MGEFTIQGTDIETLRNTKDATNKTHGRADCGRCPIPSKSDEDDDVTLPKTGFRVVMVVKIPFVVESNNQSLIIIFFVPFLYKKGYLFRDE